MRLQIKIWRGEFPPYTLDFTDKRDWDVGLSPRVEGEEPDFANPAIVATDGYLSGSFRLSGTNLDLGSAASMVYHGELNDPYTGEPEYDAVIREAAKRLGRMVIHTLNDSCSGKDADIDLRSRRLPSAKTRRWLADHDANAQMKAWFHSRRTS